MIYIENGLTSKRKHLYLENADNKTQKKSLYKVGLVLIIVSFILWLVPLTVPFTPLPTHIKASLAAGAIVTAEVMFWLGAAIVGKEAATKYRKKLNPKNWHKKSTDHEDSAE